MSEHHFWGGIGNESLEHRLLRAILESNERQEKILAKIEEELRPKVLQSSGATVTTIQG